jgi:transposase
MRLARTPDGSRSQRCGRHRYLRGWLARFARAYGLKAVEVNRPDRSLRRRRGKSDPIDARATLAGVATTTPKTREGQGCAGEAAFAYLCGTAPIPASSGRTHRHRLNRGGDRHANHALWRIALVRMRCHPPTRADVERRTNQGLSKLDIMPCLKRDIAREVYHHLTDPPASTPPTCPK